ncbi:ubiquinol-cytochrome c reductase iron-sulfur subunit [Acidobacteriota bacterium]
MTEKNDKEKPQGWSRRDTLNVLLSASAIASAGAVLYPVLHYLKPPEQSGTPTEVVVADGDKAKLQTSGFAIIRFGRFRVIVFRDAVGKLHALDAKCTHEGCTVTYRGDEGLIWCACHNGKFGVDGRVISGPPPRPLDRFLVSGSLDGDLTVGQKTG